ncbi:phosphoenolpyruvate carboxykinase [Rhodospirillales bacterium YIM 152171]|uniref:Phosphoenolpyruvate carboxykinase (ATP) n=1 Tax=Marinimicrococcus flavescens TaxID=3031815 RepID=A0AAP3XSC0_9PROT|nr:phosphoenolpyruvate carboxykinase [Marinimicrococcus flavescens]
MLRNLAPAALVTEALRRGEAELSASGALVADTGVFTGRSPGDKYVVDHPAIHEAIDWSTNKPLAPGRFDALKARALEHLAGRELFVQDLYAGADPAHRLSVRVVTEQAWHSLFARNMFIRPAPSKLPGFTPDWTVLQLPSFAAEPASDGTSSSTVIALDFKERLVLIAGTAYAGEIKKSIFTVLNFLLPEAGVLPMHCSANMDGAGSTALFFGLSGTGKTTLSADPNRILIGDDEHGWGEHGVFNFEGGCYAKVIRLDPEAEPEIWAASNRFGTILENVVLDPDSREPDFDSASRTENTRSSYPLPFIPNASENGRGGHPRDIVMLTADAFGVLPPIGRLSPGQAMYHFLSGYTARVAGTERGVTEPQATFSACFGAPFMPRRPTVYARLLGELMRRHEVRCWLVNTGWTGGAHGTGRRMPLEATRALVQAALDGSLAGVETRTDPVFGMEVPVRCAGVDPRILNPRECWDDAAAYERTAREVAALFQKNFEKFEAGADAETKAAAIRAAG